MCSLEWGRLYKKQHQNPYDANLLVSGLKELYGDPYVKNRRGIYEYLLDGEQDTQLLDLRVFDVAINRSSYKRQTDTATTVGQSNCLLCSVGIDSNKVCIWAFDEMEADHVTAWSKGGSTTSENCQMLCKTHNRSKGNR